MEGNEEWATGHCDFVTFTVFDDLDGLDIFDLCLGTIIMPSLDVLPILISSTTKKVRGIPAAIFTAISCEVIASALCVTKREGVGAGVNVIRVDMWNRHTDVQKLPFWGTSYGNSSESVVAMSDSFGWRMPSGTAQQANRNPGTPNTKRRKHSKQ
ncbi:hypothetical protein PENFLA_c025G00678 [Penicillium flavigenum]|uniref:Uncharacterized protein n=1 Tax=Penicillium flavigenum TaxID=254877 RepID=A0A1V6SSU0_9EURO|nr:hypothetical protein PENFLA_c025G00678 [Penicillium flavigenum]